MKKIISGALVLAIIVIVGTTTVFARNHGSSRYRGGYDARRSVTQATTTTNRSAYTLCDIEDCLKTDLHYHGNAAYSGHYYGDGHDYHEYCAVEDCTTAGYHDHDGSYCFGHTYGDGHDYHGYCAIEDCTVEGYHYHDGGYCFERVSGGGRGCCR